MASARSRPSSRLQWGLVLSNEETPEIFSLEIVYQGFNGASFFRTRKHGKETVRLEFTDQLQWGLVLSNEETVHRLASFLFQ